MKRVLMVTAVVALMGCSRGHAAGASKLTPHEEARFRRAWCAGAFIEHSAMRGFQADVYSAVALRLLAPAIDDWAHKSGEPGADVAARLILGAVIVGRLTMQLEGYDLAREQCAGFPEIVDLLPR